MFTHLPFIPLSSHVHTRSILSIVLYSSELRALSHIVIRILQPYMHNISGFASIPYARKISIIERVLNSCTFAYACRCDSRLPSTAHVRDDNDESKRMCLNHHKQEGHHMHINGSNAYIITCYWYTFIPGHDDQPCTDDQWPLAADWLTVMLWSCVIVLVSERAYDRPYLINWLIDSYYNYWLILLKGKRGRDGTTEMTCNDVIHMH